MPFPPGTKLNKRDEEKYGKWKWTLNRNGYVCREDQGHKVMLHRLVVCAMPWEIIDHKNRNRLDCRRRNLRAVTASQNMHNRTIKSKGVYKPKGRKKWRVFLWVNNRHIWLGMFDKKSDAIKARQKAKKDLGVSLC